MRWRPSPDGKVDLFTHVTIAVLLVPVIVVIDHTHNSLVSIRFLLISFLFQSTHRSNDSDRRPLFPIDHRDSKTVTSCFRFIFRYRLFHRTEFVLRLSPTQPIPLLQLRLPSPPDFARRPIRIRFFWSPRRPTTVRSWTHLEFSTLFSNVAFWKRRYFCCFAPSRSNGWKNTPISTLFVRIRISVRHDSVFNRREH